MTFKNPKNMEIIFKEHYGQLIDQFSLFSVNLLLAPNGGATSGTSMLKIATVSEKCPENRALYMEWGPKQVK